MSYTRIFATSLLACIELSVALPSDAGVLGEKIRERIAERRAEKTVQASSNATSPSGAKRIADIAYGSDPAEKLDVYMPANAIHAPVIFMVHGGGWKHGDKDNSRVVDNKVSRWVGQGFIFISIDYPMLPEKNPLQQSQAVAQALAYAQQKAETWGGDPAAFILMGHSAGAHLVSLINANPQIALDTGAKRWLGTVALDSAAMDVPAVMSKRHMPLYDEAFGTDTTFWKSASPLHQLAAGGPPLLAVCSTERKDKPCIQAESYKRAASQLDNRVEVLPQAKSHGEINMDLGLDSVYTQEVENFMASLGKPVAAHLDK